jgi:hypothetical protein
MIMPLLSVSLIGAVAALLAVALARYPGATAVARGLTGAWLGFLAGALVGGTLDVLTRNGGFIALVGHLGAAAGTIWLLRLGRQPADHPLRPAVRVTPAGRAAE